MSDDRFDPEAWHNVEAVADAMHDRWKAVRRSEPEGWMGDLVRPVVDWAVGRGGVLDTEGDLVALADAIGERAYDGFSRDVLVCLLGEFVKGDGEISAARGG